MVDKGKLAVNCSDLWLCGRSYLPMVADAFNKGSAKAGDTVAYDGGFARVGYVGVRTKNDAMGPVQPVWGMARDELQRVMAQTAENIYQACDARRGAAVHTARQKYRGYHRRQAARRPSGDERRDRQGGRTGNSSAPMPIGRR